MSGNKLLHVLILTLICVAIWRHLANMSYYNCPSHLSIWRSMEYRIEYRIQNLYCFLDEVWMTCMPVDVNPVVCVCSSGSKTPVGSVKKNTWIVRMTLTGRTCGTQCEPLPTHPPPPLPLTHTHTRTHTPPIPPAPPTSFTNVGAPIGFSWISSGL